jgi:thiamine-monophosphate kinase
MEAEFLDWLRARLPTHPAVQLGVGDDAAILRWTGGAGCVVASDTLNEGVDFHLDQVDLRLVGHKALAVNLSDLAAMAAQPVAALVCLTLPRAGGLKIAQDLYTGILALAEQFGLAIAGGDTGSWDGPLVITVTVVGEVTEHGPLLRSGARPGDAVLVTGAFGGSILGKHLQFTPRVREALRLNREYRIHAATDVSDGLSLDLAHIVTESACGAVLDLPAIPIAADAHRLAASSTSGSTALEHALADGEDFELILAVPQDQAQRLLQDQPLEIPVTRIGTFVPERGLWTADTAGVRHRLQPRGYEH